MKLKKLNVRGFSHEFLLVAFVVIFAIAGAGYVVATHAATPTSTNSSSQISSLTVKQPNYTTVGSTTFGPVPGVNDTVTVYACHSDLPYNNWNIKVKYALTNGYTNSFGYTFKASVTNASTDPLKGFVNVKQLVPNSSSPTATFNTEVYSLVASPLNFDFLFSNDQKGGGGAVVDGYLASYLNVC